jgi:cytidylate kinase
VVVVPDAEVKIWLVADPASAPAHGTRAGRARRRRARRGAPPPRRARRREHAPAADAVEVDTTAMTLDQVIDRIVDLVRSAR